MSLLRVKDHDGLYKDSSTGAVINKDTSGYQQYMENRSKMLSDKERLDSIESDINDIKSLLLKVLESNGQ
jgi:predicted transcriptional regulator